MTFPERAGRERLCPKLEKLVGHRLFVRDTLSVALTICLVATRRAFWNRTPGSPPFRDELDAGGAGRILDEATIWLEPGTRRN